MDRERCAPTRPDGFHWGHADGSDSSELAMVTTMTHGPSALLVSQASTNPGFVYPPVHAPPELEPRSIGPMLMWARAYRLAGERGAAAACLRRAFATAFAMETPNTAREQAIAFTEDLASEFIESGEVTVAADLVRLAAAWDQADPDRTAVTDHKAKRYQQAAAVRAVPPPPPPASPATVVYDRAQSYDDEMDEVTLIFRRSDLIRPHSS